MKTYFENGKVYGVGRIGSHMNVVSVFDNWEEAQEWVNEEPKKRKLMSREQAIETTSKDTIEYAERTLEESKNN